MHNHSSGLELREPEWCGKAHGNPRKWYTTASNSEDAGMFARGFGRFR